MELRSLRGPEDMQAVHRINAAAWRAAYQDILPDAVLNAFDTRLDAGEARRRYQRVTDQDGVFRLAIDDDNAGLGYVFMRWDPTKDFVEADQAGLKEIYVSPDHWGNGIGTTLLEAAIAELPEWVTGLRLEMLAGNDVGESFYESRGFTQVGTGTVDLQGESYPTVIYEKQF